MKWVEMEGATWSRNGGEMDEGRGKGRLLVRNDGCGEDRHRWVGLIGGLRRRE